MPNSDLSKKPRRNRKLNLELRRKCKEKLAEHINSETDLSIETSQVSLHKTERYGYYWVFQNEFIARLFSKRLSSLSMSACRQLSQEVGYTFRAVATSKLSKYPDCNHGSLQMTGTTPTEQYNGPVMPYAPLIANIPAASEFNEGLVCREEADRLKIELQNLNIQHECAVQQLQDCRTHLQAVMEKSERYESFVLNGFLRMDDMERMVDSLREGFYQVLGGHTEEHNTGDIQSQNIKPTVFKAPEYELR